MPPALGIFRCRTWPARIPRSAESPCTHHGIQTTKTTRVPRMDGLTEFFLLRLGTAPSTSLTCSPPLPSVLQIPRSDLRSRRAAEPLFPSPTSTSRSPNRRLALPYSFPFRRVRLIGLLYLSTSSHHWPKRSDHPPTCPRALLRLGSQLRRGCRRSIPPPRCPIVFPPRPCGVEIASGPRRRSCWSGERRRRDCREGS